VTLRRFASLAGALVVAAIAALASYSHMRAVALQYGQPELIADLLPISVDGMMAVATVALGDGRRNRWSAWLAFWTGVAASVLANVLAAEPSVVARCISAWPAITFVLVVEVITRGGRRHVDRALTGPDTNPAAPPGTPASSVVELPAGTSAAQRATSAAPLRKPTKTIRRPISQTRELAANLRAEFPKITQAELAHKLGISATRLHQIDRAEPSAEPAQPVNGADMDELAEVSA